MGASLHPVEPAAPIAPARPSGDFLDHLVRRALLDAASAQRARSAQASSGQALAFILLELGLLPETALAHAQAEFHGLKPLDTEDYPAEALFRETVSRDFLRRSDLLPVAATEAGVVFAAPRPVEPDVLAALGFLLDRPVELRIAARSEFEAAFRRLYEGEDAGPQDGVEEGAAHEDDIERLKDVAREAPIIRLAARLIADAVERGASDIHIEPTEAGVRVRYRLDGLLRTVETLPKSAQAGLISRMKVLSQLNIAERRLPQDGRIKIPVRGREIDFRVSTLPTLHGEGVVMRVLDRGSLTLDFAALGFEDSARAELEDLLRHPDGIVLVTGPTGSGKTTTLYAGLTRLNCDDRKIFTVEDPVEYHLPGIVQVPVRPQIGLDFVACLRSILRQDPDIVMVGEIRDAETARIAIQAALTGHLVLSTLHTNSAAAAMTRLLDMGLEDYLLASTLRGVVAQRLVRRLCGACAQPYRPEPGLAARLKLDRIAAEAGTEMLLHRGAGCAACQGSGYRGRTTISEILTMDEQVRELVMARAPDRRIEAAARQAGMRSLFVTGARKALNGETSIEEVLRIARADE